MKGIYLTQESKQEIEAKIAELEQRYKNEKDFSDPSCDILEGIRSSMWIYKGILKSATILPVEESWESLGFDFATIPSTLQYSQGVIIQPK